MVEGNPTREADQMVGHEGALDRLIGGIAWLSRLGGVVAVGLLLAAVLVICQMVFVRYVLKGSGIWQHEFATFALIGTTFIGAALAAHASRLTPPWQRLLGVAGGGLLLAAGAANLAIADGSAFLFVGVSGLAAWLVWLLATGVRLVRS